MGEEAKAKLSKAARDQLIMDHYEMVQRISMKMVRRYPSNVDVRDLISLGTLGLIDASERYDPKLNTAFGAYATIRIKGAIVDGLRKQDWVPRGVRSLSKDLDAAKQQAVIQEGSDSNEALAKVMGVELETVTTMKEQTQIQSQVSMWEQRGGSEQTIADTLADDQATPEERLARKHEAAKIRRAVAKLPEREQHIARLRYFDNLQFKEIGEILGVTEARISQLHSRLKKHLAVIIQEMDAEEG
jgi:RNA polymerase sigma factor for flagellar operon FliA